MPVFLKAYENKAPVLPVSYEAPEHLRDVILHEIDFYVTMKCNLRCQFCSVRAGEYDHEDLPLDRCLSLIDEAAALGLKELHFLGGEPTLRDDLEDMIRHATGYGVSTRVITNGMLLDRARIGKLMDAGLGELMFSLDGMADAHNELRCSGTKGWSRTVRALEDAIAMGIRTRVAMTAYDRNKDDVLPLLRFSHDVGADRFSVFLGSPLGRGRDLVAQVIKPHAWRRLQESVTEELGRLARPISVVMEQGFAWADGPAVDREQLKGRGTGCNTLLEDYDYLIVRSDGDLYQCVFFMTEGKPIGNILAQPLKESLQYALEKADYRSFTVASDKCVTCLHQTDCGTGCRGYAHLLKEDWLSTDPRCAKDSPLNPVAPEYYPLCPILKWNARSGAFGGSSEQAMSL
ncbi:MAG: radical SAM protein [Methylocystis sp.]|uniref:radical SAM/SPASM domain-containing protein n=1 Tax=Phenylobacterium sp. TaxID=1871053 RepID=UPI0025F06E6F|nr:radical SAM protein [Phenylobacterium sp.]MCA3585178.1 radical SAM protein [Methylocystis sp.]MCA6346663.1 radical SAM protein [Phenylobacterium sp.]MCA6349259.1 radical SAM protein [Phenylobacterium sp.]MCA6352221.1 radical SAM protein [Phenylobacterium sp.]MCA6355574.1 radical SAM protein [Phenylobacterium sp.]